MTRNPQSAFRIPREPTLRERFEELNAASSRDAAALAAQGKRVSVCKLWFAPLVTFARAYLWSGEWRHGIAGLISALFSAYAVFVCYAKLWEHWQGRPGAEPPPRS